MEETIARITTNADPAPRTPIEPAVPGDGDDNAPGEDHEVHIQMRDFSVFYGDVEAVKKVTLDIRPRCVTAIIGPSGCGKSTLLRAINRMNDLIPGCRASGEMVFEGRDIYESRLDVTLLRRRIGMVFQKPNPFPKSIFDNVAYGPKLQGITRRPVLMDIVERSLRDAALWDEVKDRLDENALGLSGGQQQRLCIARAIAVEPEILLMDEPCSALDPIATGKIEDLIEDLKREYTIVIVTHNMQQASRTSDFTVFMYMGDLIEYGRTDKLFSNPSKKETEDYITGRFG